MEDWLSRNWTGVCNQLQNISSITIDGIADIKINVVWEDADISISISQGSAFNLDPDDEDTENRIGDQFVHGIVTRLI